MSMLRHNQTSAEFQGMPLYSEVELHSSQSVTWNLLTARTVAKKPWIRGLYVYAGGIYIESLIKTPLIYSVSYLNFGVLALRLRGVSPPKPCPRRRDCSHTATLTVLWTLQTPSCKNRVLNKFLTKRWRAEDAQTCAFVHILTCNLYLWIKWRGENRNLLILAAVCRWDLRTLNAVVNFVASTIWMLCAVKLCVTRHAVKVIAQCYASIFHALISRGEQAVI